MFKVNDYVVYQYWICKIVDITKLENNIIGFDNNSLFYVMKSLYEKETFYIPMENEKSLREPLNKSQVLKLIDDIPNIEPLNILTDELYKKTIHNYDCYSYIKIIKSINDKSRRVDKVGKRLSTLDSKYMYLAEKYLFDEFSFALDIQKDSVDNFIKDRLNVNHVS